MRVVSRPCNRDEPARFCTSACSLQLVATFWAVGTVLFFLFRLMPGNPTSFVISPQMTPEARRQIIESYGLDEPMHVQYVKFPLQNAITPTLDHRHNP